jgi:hypothetical protein
MHHTGPHLYTRPELTPEGSDSILEAWPKGCLRLHLTREQSHLCHDHKLIHSPNRIAFHVLYPKESLDAPY